MDCFMLDRGKKGLDDTMITVDDSGGFGYHGYGKAGWPRRARIILAELQKGKKSWMDVQRIMTWKRLDDEKMSKIDEQILWQSR